VSCGNGVVWSGEAQACTDSHSAALTEQDFYNEARTLADEGQYQAALDTLAHIKNQEQARVLNLIGYNTRKLGEVDKGLDYSRSIRTTCWRGNISARAICRKATSPVPGPS
jgi:hypothetical protein